MPVTEKELDRFYILEAGAVIAGKGAGYKVSGGLEREKYYCVSENFPDGFDRDDFFRGKFVVDPGEIPSAFCGYKKDAAGQIVPGVFAAVPNGNPSIVTFFPAPGLTGYLDGCVEERSPRQDPRSRPQEGQARPALQFSARPPAQIPSSAAAASGTPSAPPPAPGALPGASTSAAGRAVGQAAGLPLVGILKQHLGNSRSVVLDFFYEHKDLARQHGVVFMREGPQDKASRSVLIRNGETYIDYSAQQDFGNVFEQTGVGFAKVSVDPTTEEEILSRTNVQARVDKLAKGIKSTMEENIARASSVPAASGHQASTNMWSTGLGTGVATSLPGSRGALGSTSIAAASLGGFDDDDDDIASDTSDLAPGSPVRGSTDTGHRSVGPSSAVVWAENPVYGARLSERGLAIRSLNKKYPGREGQDPEEAAKTAAAIVLQRKYRGFHEKGLAGSNAAEGENPQSRTRVVSATQISKYILVNPDVNAQIRNTNHIWYNTDRRNKYNVLAAAYFNPEELKLPTKIIEEYAAKRAETMMLNILKIAASEAGIADAQVPAIILEAKQWGGISNDYVENQAGATSLYAPSKGADPTRARFSARFQQLCGECGIKSGRNPKDGLRLTFLPERVIEELEEKLSKVDLGKAQQAKGRQKDLVTSIDSSSSRI